MADPVEKVIEEIAKNLPIRQVYEDAASGATKQVGHALIDVAKTIRLALVPFQALAAVQDRVERFIDRSIRRVPDERRISPAPQILGPVLEGIRYEAEDTPVQEMFSQLLSRAFDSARVDEAHPAYPILIRQLSPDEAVIVAKLKSSTFDYIYTRDFDAATGLFVGQNKVEVDRFPREGLLFPHNLPFYFDHLQQLGLAGVFQQGNQQALYDGPPATRQIGIRARCKYALTDFGRRFATACIDEER